MTRRIIWVIFLFIAVFFLDEVASFFTVEHTNVGVYLYGIMTGTIAIAILEA